MYVQQRKDDLDEKGWLIPLSVVNDHLSTCTKKVRFCVDMYVFAFVVMYMICKLVRCI